MERINFPTEKCDPGVDYFSAKKSHYATPDVQQLLFFAAPKEMLTSLAMENPRASLIAEQIAN